MRKQVYQKAYCFCVNRVNSEDGRRCERQAGTGLVKDFGKQHNAAAGNSRM